VLFLFDWNSLIRLSSAYLGVGVFLLSVAIAARFTGEVSSRYSRVYRARELGLFWSVVAICYISVVLFIGMFFLK
jgi:hypothetical protein